MAKNITYETNYEIYYFSDNLINIFGHTYTYSGGAHPNSNTSSKIFLLIDGKFQKIELGDLFLPNSNYLKKLSELCIADLKKQEASSITSEEITDLSDALAHTVFTVTPYGISLYFDPYAVASYAEGAFQVNIPLVKIKDILDTNKLTPEMMKKIKK
jgi:hypothetical protein